MTKVRYEVDPHNRLVIKKTGKLSRLAKYRTCLEGTFRTDSRNFLIFETKLTTEDKPQQIKLKGSWKLDKEHNLVFILNKWGNQIAGNKLTLTGQILDLRSNELTFSLITKEEDGRTTLYTLNLSGAWQVDVQNRLTFNVEKQKGNDYLKFSSSWSLKNNLITYKYIKNDPINGNKSTQSLTLNGFWEISEKYRLTYVLDKEFGSDIAFRASLGEPIISGQRYGLKYELGAGFTKNDKKKEIIIFGKWQIKQNIGLEFEVEYENGIKHAINFNATAKLNNNYSLTLKLKNPGNDDLGIILELSRKILNTGEGFVRLFSDQNEKAIEIGAGFRW